MSPLHGAGDSTLRYSPLVMATEGVKGGGLTPTEHAAVSPKGGRAGERNV